MPLLVGCPPRSVLPGGEWVKEHRNYPQWFDENAAIAFLPLGTIWCWKWFSQVSWLVLSIYLLRSTKCPMARVNTDRRSRCLQCPDQHGLYQNCKELLQIHEEPKVPGDKTAEMWTSRCIRGARELSNPGGDAQTP